MAILTLEEFWNLIEKSHESSEGDPLEQEIYLVEKLKNRTLEDIYAFHEYFSYLTGKLATDLLFNAMLKLKIDMSDSIWEYRRGHIVALGKKMFEMALKDVDSFVETLKSRKYGDPEDISHEFWSISDQASRKKTGNEYAFLKAKTDRVKEEIERELQKFKSNLKK